MRTRIDPDNSTVRKYRIERGSLDSDIVYWGCGECNCDGTNGYIFEIYDCVIDVACSGYPDDPIASDARLITTVFVCDECYQKRTNPNE